MTFKSIMTVLTDGPHGADALAPASDMATRFDAHLDAMALGINRTQAGYNYGDVSAIVYDASRKAAIEESVQVAATAEKALAGASLRSSVIKAVSPASDLARVVSAHARFNDLVVLSKPYGPDAEADDPSIAEACLFDASVPTLICPRSLSEMPPAKRVVLAWNESAEALAACRAALPLLKAADSVFITVIDPPAHGPTRSDPGGPLSQMLARHGVRCEVDVLSKSLPRVSDVLNRHVEDKDADLLVMGAYGHSRFREAIFGGATRNMLESATVPVFMAR